MENWKIRGYRITRKSALKQNYPNPVNPGTIISFTIPRTSEVTLAIYNLRGQIIRTLHSGLITAGSHQATWYGTDVSGVRIASGIYVYRLEAQDFVTSKKLVVVK